MPLFGRFKKGLSEVYHITKPITSATINAAQQAAEASAKASGLAILDELSDKIPMLKESKEEFEQLQASNVILKERNKDLTEKNKKYRNRIQTLRRRLKRAS